MLRKRLRRADGDGSSGEDEAVAAGSNGEDDAVAAGRDVSGADSDGASEGASDAEEKASRATHSSACARSDTAVIRGCCMYLPLSSPIASAELMQVSSLASPRAHFCIPSLDGCPSLTWPAWQALTRTPQAHVGATPEVRECKLFVSFANIPIQ